MRDLQDWSEIEAILTARGLVLPPVSAPRSRHLPYRRNDSLVLLSGILPLREDGTVLRGTFGDDLGDEDGETHGLALALTTIATIKAYFRAPGDATVFEALVFVSSTADYESHHRIADSFSGLLVDALGEDSQHARTTVGIAALALGASLEVRCQLEVAVR